MDVDGLTFACAMTVEERIARRLGRTALVGLGASRGVPDGRLVSFGIAGALSADLPIGTVIDATRVVDESGTVLWEGGPLGAASSRGSDIAILRSMRGPLAIAAVVATAAGCGGSGKGGAPVPAGRLEQGVDIRVRRSSAADARLSGQHEDTYGC